MTADSIGTYGIRITIDKTAEQAINLLRCCVIVNGLK